MAEKINTSGATAKEIAQAIGEVLKNSESMSETTLKIKTDSSIYKAKEEVKGLTEALVAYENYINKKKNNYSKTSYFTTEEKAINRLKNAWELYAKERNSGIVNENNLAKSDSAKKVLILANALEALTGRNESISEISQEISKLVSHMRELPNFKNYNLDVSQFKEVFDLLKNIQKLYPDVSEITKPFNGLESTVETLTSLIKIQTSVPTSSTNSMTEAYEEQTKAVEKVVEQVKALTEAEMEAKLKLEHNKSDVYEWEIDLDENLEDIQKYSKALDELRQQQEDALWGATYYQNEIAKGNNNGNTEWMQNSIKDYHKYTDQIEFVQERLQKAIHEYTPSANGENGKELNALIVILKDLREEIIKIRAAFIEFGESNSSLTPVLEMIDKINSAILEMSQNIKSIGFNMNIDVGSDKEIESKIQSKISIALQAYQKLFDQLKFSGAGGSIINTSFFDFDINQYDTMMGKLTAYRKFIDSMRKEAKRQFNGKDILYESIDKEYWTSASAAMGQVTRAFNEMKAVSNTDPLKEMFGKTDLSGIITQLEEISSIIEKGLSVNEVINGKTTDTGEEVKGLEAVKQSVESITTAVNKKSEAFKNEEATVARVVPNETNYLGKLISALKIINEQLEKISQFTGLDLSKIKIPETNIAQGKIAEGATTISNNPKEAIKNKVRNVTKADTTMTAEQLAARTKSLTEETAKLETNLIAQGSVIKELTEFYDSQDNLVKTVIKEQQELEGLLKTTTWTTNYDLKNNTSFSSHIDSNRYEDVEKKKEKERLEQAKRFANEEKKEKDKLTKESYDIEKKYISEIYSLKEKNAKAIETNSKTQKEDIVYNNMLIASYEELINDEKEYRNEKGLANDNRNQEYELRLIAEYEARREAYNTSLKESIKLAEQEAYIENEKRDKIAYRENEKENTKIIDSQQKKWQAFYKEQQDYLSKTYEAESVERNKKANQELIDTIQQYGEVAKRIANNKTLDGDIELAEKLENKISDLQKQPILSSSQIDESERKLEKLFNQLDAIEKRIKKEKQEKENKEQIALQKKLETANAESAKKEQKERINDSSNLLKEQRKEYEEIYKIILSISKLDTSKDSKEIAELKQQGELHVRNYNNLEKNLEIYQDIINKEKQSNELLAIKIKYQNQIDISKAKIKDDKKNESEKILSKKSKDSYDKEYKLEQEINKLRIKNISASKEEKLINEQNIARKQDLIEKEKIYRTASKLENSEEETKLINKKTTLFNELKDAQEDFNTKMALSTRYAGQVVDYIALISSEMQGLNTSFGLFENIEANKEDGSATIKFVKEIGKQTQTTLLKVKNLDTTLTELQKGTFDVSNYTLIKSSISNNKTSNDTSINKSKKQIDEISKAYNELRKSEKDYQKLNAKKSNNVSLTSTEKVKLEELSRDRENYNNILKQTIVLTEKQYQAQKEYEYEQKRVQNNLPSYKELIGTEHNQEAIEAYEKLIKKAKDYYTLKSNKDDLVPEQILLLEELEKDWEDAYLARGRYATVDLGNSELKEQLKNIRELFQTGSTDSYSATIHNYADKMFDKYKRLETNKKKFKYVDEYYEKLTSLELKIKELQEYNLDTITEEDLQEVKKLQAGIENLYSEVNSMTKNFSFQLADPEDIKKQMANIRKTLADNTAMPSNLKRIFEALEKKYQLLIDTKGTEEQVKKVNEELADLNYQLQKSGKTGDSVFTTLIKRVKNMSTNFFAMYLSMYDIFRYGQQIFQIIEEYDSNLTEMTKVSAENTRVLQDFQKESFELADAIGTTASTIQSSTADFMRLGESLEEAKQSAQDANVLFQVSEFENISEATDALIAMSAAYKDLDKSEINDILNEIGNNYSISTDELASALQRSAATLKVAGNDIYEATALVTAGNSVLQDAEAVGTGLKMISLRILGTEEAKEELAELGEDVDDFVVQTKSKLNETIRNYTAVASNNFKGISILDDNGNYRSTFQILKDISQVYQEILKTDKEAGTNRGQALLEVLAGKNRSNVAASILNSPELLTSVYESALNAEGSAQEELEKHLESIEAHINSLKNAWEELWINENNREIINFFIDLAKSILENINNFGVLKTLLVGGSGIFSIIQSQKSGGRAKCCSLIKNMLPRSLTVTCTSYAYVA